jgi:hypothetical protein
VSELTSILTEAFNINAEEGSPDFEVLPKGSYVAAITDAKVGPLKSGRGQAISLTWEIEGGKHANRKIFDRVIVQHENDDAMRIGRQKLKDICDACEVKGTLTDLTVLRNNPVSIYVVIEQDAAGEYPPKNIVKRVKPIARPDKSDKPIAGNGAKLAVVEPDYDDKNPF